jgi:hypothetical protein
MCLYVVDHVSLSINQYCHIQEYLQGETKERGKLRRIIPLVFTYACSELLPLFHKSSMELREYLIVSELMQMKGDLLQLQKLPLQIPYSVMSLLYLSNSVQYLDSTELS